MESSTRYLRIRAVAAVVLAALVLVLGLPAARAEVARTGDEPWYRQVPAEVRQRAETLFVQALDKHQQLLRGEAKELYEQALALWDNPDIQWNLALVLEDLGEYLRAHQQLDGALRWETALGTERLREVRDRMHALETQRLARIETSLEEPLADFTLDGKPWPRRAGRRSALVMPGEHYIVASKSGYFTVTRSVTVAGGQQARVALPMDEALIEARRWTAWKPWVVVGGGALVGLVAGGLQLSANSSYDEFEAKLARCTPDAMNGSCDASQFTNLRDSGDTKRTLGIVGYGIAGAAIVTGGLLVYLNRRIAYRITTDEYRTEGLRKQQAPQKKSVSVAPLVGPGVGGAVVMGKF